MLHQFGSRCLGRAAVAVADFIPLIFERSVLERQAASLINEESENYRARNSEQREVSNHPREASKRSDQRGNQYLREHRKRRRGDALPSEHRGAQRGWKKFRLRGIRAYSHHAAGNLEPAVRDEQPGEWPRHPPRSPVEGERAEPCRAADVRHCRNPPEFFRGPRADRKSEHADSHARDYQRARGDWREAEYRYCLEV